MNISFTEIKNKQYKVCSYRYYIDHVLKIPVNKNTVRTAMVTGKIDYTIDDKGKRMIVLTEGTMRWRPNENIRRSKLTKHNT